jgi:hypothetical protein
MLPAENAQRKKDYEDADETNRKERSRIHKRERRLKLAKLAALPASEIEKKIEGGEDESESESGNRIKARIPPLPFSFKCGYFLFRATRPHRLAPNENKMSDGGRERASFGVEVISKVERTLVRRSLHRMVWPASLRARIRRLSRSTILLPCYTFARNPTWPIVD